MNIQVKRTVKAGNSSAVILPKAWLDKEVRVELIEKTPEKILEDVLEIVREYIDQKSIVGIYLAGSYARDEEDEGSDIDVVVVTDKVDKKTIMEGIYNILIVSSSLISWKLENDLFPIGQMLREAIPLLNTSYLDSLDINVTKKNVEWYLKTTEDKLNLVERVLRVAKSKNMKYLSDKVAYTLVLRIRTIYIIDKMIERKDYSKKEFIRLVRKISDEAYEGYLSVKNDLKPVNNLSVEDAEKLYDYLKKEMVSVKKKVKNF